MKIRRNSLAEHLNHLLGLAQGQDVTVQIIINELAGRGQAVLLILFSLPFCLPIQIPGVSTPFGMILAFIGLRIAFGHRAWIPKSLMEKKIPYGTLKKVATFAIKFTEKLRFLTSTRWVWLVQNTYLHVIHGLTIALLSIILALPVPIPFTNLLAAYPILAFGLGILEDDGLMITIGYVLTIACFSFFIGLILFGKNIIL